MFDSYFKLIGNPINKEIRLLKEKYQRHTKVFEEFLIEKNKVINQLKKENRNIQLENKELIQEKNRLIEEFNNLKRKYQKLCHKNRAPVSKNTRLFVLERDNHRCLACGTEENLTLDHIIPRSKGGTNDIDNLQVLCQYCNLSKGVNEVDYRHNNVEALIKNKGDKL